MRKRIKSHRIEVNLSTENSDHHRRTVGPGWGGEGAQGEGGRQEREGRGTGKCRNRNKNGSRSIRKSGL